MGAESGGGEPRLLGGGGGGEGGGGGGGMQTDLHDAQFTTHVLRQDVGQ